MRHILLLLTVFAALRAYEFRSADSLVLAGRTGPARRELLSHLEDGGLRNEVLFRLAGLYHGCGMEDRCILLLDSIEAATGEDLHGWKVSLLDLSRRRADARSLVPDDEPLLSLWLQRDLEEPELPSVLPAPIDLAERAVRAMFCQDGRMSKGQVEQTVLDAAFLPFLAEEVMAELEIGMKSEGDWWDRTAAQLHGIHASSDLELLLAMRDLHLSSGSREEWERRLALGGPVSAVAALELLRLYPSEWAGSWMLADVLLEGGMVSRADSLAAASGDGVYSLGVSMAVLRESGRYAELLALCDSMGGGMPDSLLARAALFRARALRALQRPAGEYYRGYLDFASLYPWHPTASEAAYLAGRFFDSERDWPRASDAYLAALRSGDYGGARAHWRGGFCCYMAGRGAVGDSVWSSGIELYPYSAWCDDMLFWRARYANRKGDGVLESRLMEEAASRHPWEFYGILAADRLGSSGRQWRMPDFRPSSDPVTAEAVTMMSRGYGTMASLMLHTTEAAEPGRRAMTLALMGEHQRSLEVLRGLDWELRDSGSGILPDSLLVYYFPAPYRELTETSVSGLGVPVELITGLMRQESYFNRWARSWVGATGLIQLMPGTAGDIARWYDLPVLSGDDFYDPSKSILYGSIYLARQLSAFQGSPLLALAAYNAGPGNAAKWMEEFPLEEGDPELFIEQIPLTETRGYVKHVLANSWIYGGLLR